MDILSRLKEIVTYSGMSIRALALRCGIPQKTLDNQIKGLRSVSTETIVSVLHAFPEVSAEWFIRGVGEMVISTDNNSAEKERVFKLVDTITTLQDTINAKNDVIATLSERIKQLDTTNNRL